MTDAVAVRGLTYSAGRSFTLRDVSLTVPAGAIYGFLGPNGAGKTTTIRLLLGMVRARAGTVRLLGHDVPQALPEALARIGYVPERPHVYPALSVREAMRCHGAFHRRWDATWAERLRDMFSLDPERTVGRLSKGETGKLLMLLALAQRPDLLILDEPTDGLDPMVRRDVLSAVLDYVSQAGATVFISSHLVHELERICDWIGVLDHGRMVAEMPIDVLKGGVKRIRFASGSPAAAAVHAAPFTVLSSARDPLAACDTWVVRGWEDPMLGFFDSAGTEVRDVLDLDLEEYSWSCCELAGRRAMTRELSQMLRLQWLSSRWLVALLVMLCVGLPQAVVRSALSRAAIHDAVVVPEVLLRGLAGAEILFVLLAVITGALIALTSWNWDHRTNHVYALALPVSRARYALLKLWSGLLVLMVPVAALLVGSLIATATVRLPAGLHAYPVAFSIRFLLAALLIYALMFALASGTVRTTLLIFGTILGVLVGGSMLVSLIETALSVDLITPVQAIADAISTFGGPFEVFTGSWLLIDV